MEYVLPEAVSIEGQNFIDKLLEADMNSRPSAKEAMDIQYMIEIGSGATLGIEAMKIEASNKKVELISSTRSLPPLPPKPRPMHTQMRTNTTKISFENTIKLLKEFHVKKNGIYEKLLKKLNVKPSAKMYGDMIVDKKRRLRLVHYVAEKGMVDVLKELLQEKLNLEAGADSVEWGMVDAKPIHFAAVNDWVECLILLIEAGADLNAKEKDGWTALHWAARNGKVRCVKALIDAGADVNTINSYGETVLHVAARNEFVDCVKALIEAGADLNAKENIYDSTVLHVAARNGFVHCVNALIEAGADLNAKENNYAYTALHMAARYGYVDCVNALIGAGAYLNAINSYFETALHVAARYGFVDCVEALIEAGADVKLENNIGRTALDKAIEWNKVECVKYIESVIK